jgi:uncharacterized protein YjbI with pentapeptide repeats
MSEVSHAGAYWNYIRHRAESHPGETICLRKLHFKNFESEESDDIAQGCSLDFSESSFENCRIENWTMKDVIFRGCRFSKSKFVDCKFAGTSFDFSSTYIESFDDFFYNCEFGSIRPAPEELGRLDFGSCVVENGKRLFGRCSANVSFLSLHESELRISGLEIAIIASSKGEGRATKRVIVRDHGIWLFDVDSIDLSQFYLEGRLKIETLRTPQESCSPRLNVERTNLAAMASAEFRNVNFERADFSEAIVGDSFFINCKWPTASGYNIAWNEELLCSQRHTPNNQTSAWRELEHFYGQLRKNYEKNGSYAEAGHWHYREMEARRNLMNLEFRGSRLSRWFHCDVISLSAWYKRISNYGESQTRPLVWIAAIFLSCAVLYSYCGVKIGDEPATRGISDLLTGAIYSLHVMTLQYGKNATATNPFGYFLSLFQLLLTAIIVPLFLLAVRRKFRR